MDRVPAPVSDPRARPVAVFDSGVGGLTVLHELLVSLPAEDYLYLGDTARFPYGERSPAELVRFSLEIAELLLARGAKLLVVACNSATAAALEPLRERMATTTLGVEVIGVVEPVARLAAAASLNGRIGLLATDATVASGAYDRAVAADRPAARLTSVAATRLAPIIQGGDPFDRVAVDTVREYCRPLRDAGVDTVILGCTHYPLVAPMIQRTLGRGVRLISSATATAVAVEQALINADLENQRTGEGDYRFLCTGEVEPFRALGGRFLQLPLEDVSRVGLPVAAARAFGLPVGVGG
ncbi:MAG: glutamate racemase [Solirubrobacteraceae bacterium]|jgi:glutamate racemase|nr:glutamate racemase [Solirubrobacteraceae bacterium]